MFLRRSSVWNVAPQTLRRRCSVKLPKYSLKPDDEVGLGEERIDREIDLELLVHLDEALADRRRMRRELARRELHHVFEADRDDDAVDRLLGPVALEELEEAEPAVLVGLGVRVLRRVAAGGIDQHRLVGEPPVAVARAAGAGDRRAAIGSEQRELEARLEERRGLAGAGRADDDVPGQRVEVVATCRSTA